MADIETNFNTLASGSVGSVSELNENFATIHSKLNEIQDNIEQFMYDLSSDDVGVVNGGIVSIGSGLTVNITDITAWWHGQRITVSSAGGYTAVTVPDDSTSYVFLKASDGSYIVGTSEDQYTNVGLLICSVIAESGSVTSVYQKSNTLFTLLEGTRWRITPLGLFAYERDDGQVFVQWSYQDVTDLDHFELQRWSETSNSWVDVDNNIIPN